MLLQPGQIIHQRYHVQRLLGQGGFGAVYDAWDSKLAGEVALKESLETSPAAQKQFEFEARLLFRLVHPNLPRVHDYFILPKQGMYLVMDYVEGEDLGTMLERVGRPLPEVQIANWICQVCDALEYLHSQQPPIIHRDIKPSNIRITPRGKAMLVDFGIAKVHDPNMRTTIGARALTPGYSPQEQYGEGMTDARSDIYALGATLYHLVTGRKPLESIQRNLGFLLPPPRQFNPDLSEAIQAVTLQAMEMLPERRYQSAVALRRDLSVLPAPPLVQDTMVYPAQVFSTEPVWPVGQVSSTAALVYPAPLSPPTESLSQSKSPPGNQPLQRIFIWSAVGAITMLLLVMVVAGMVWVATRSAFSISPATQTALAQRGQAVPTQRVVPTTAPSASPSTAPSTETSVPGGTILDTLPAPVSSAVPTAQPLPPTDLPATPNIGPEQFVRQYFELINQRQYTESWSLLSDTFKQKFHCCAPGGGYAFEPYVTWNDSIERIEVVKVRIISQSASQASVLATFKYFYKDGRVVNDSARLDLAKDAEGNWLIEDQSG